jgi:hypothetical protein
MFVPHMKLAYGPPRPVTEIALLSFYERQSQNRLTVCTETGDNTNVTVRRGVRKSTPWPLVRKRSITTVYIYLLTEGRGDNTWLVINYVMETNKETHNCSEVRLLWIRQKQLILRNHTTAATRQRFRKQT